MVKEFINNQAERYNVPVVYEGGDPRLVFLDELGEELKTINVKNYDSKGIQKLLEDHGFYPVY